MHVSVDLIDLSGREVLHVINDFQQKGYYSISKSITLDKGLYFIRYSMPDSWFL